MRYYDIKIKNAKTGEEILPKSLNGGKLSSLLPNGQTNPSALNIEFDIPVAPFAAPAGQAYLRIWGLSLQEIGSAFNLNDAIIEIRGGMQKGLPLATQDFQAGQSGLLVRGQVFQAFGNWAGTAQTIDVVMTPGTGLTDDAKPTNWVLDWRAGKSLASALKTTFDRAVPDLTQNIAISDRLIQPYDEVHYTYTLEGLAVLLRNRSKDIVTDATYQGVEIYKRDQTIYAVDQTTPLEAKKIQPYDLLGQPTWIQFNTIQIKTNLRADLYLQDVITLPQTLMTTTQAAFSNFSQNPKDKTTFTGKFVIKTIQHYGNFRQADAASWNTTINAYREPE